MPKLIKRIKWRLRNLRFRDFLLSFFPKEVVITELNAEDYLRRFQNRIEYDASAAPIESPPFIIIKPSGIPHAEKIKQILKDKNIRIIQECDIDDYIGLAIHIYRFKPIFGDSVPIEYLWFRWDELKYPNQLDKCKSLILDKTTVNHEQIFKLKKYLRRHIGPIRFYRLRYKDFSDTVLSTYLHIPDPEDAPREYFFLTHFISEENGKQDACPTTATVKHITKLRYTHDVYLTINAMIRQGNFDKLEEITDFIINLSPDDFKLIPTSEFAANMGDEEKNRLQSLFKNKKTLRERFPFFYYRLEHIHEMRGLKSEKYRHIRCYLCLDERTVNSEAYYPCSIYLREGGEPIGSIKEDFLTQTKKLWKFANEYEVTKDRICNEYCCDITRDFNLLVHNCLHSMGNYLW